MTSFAYVYLYPFLLLLPLLTSPFAQGSLLSVAFMNLTLSHNSVGFYQVSGYSLPMKTLTRICPSSPSWPASL
jgi:hypothetical protein